MAKENIEDIVEGKGARPRLSEHSSTAFAAIGVDLANKGIYDMVSNGGTEGTYYIEAPLFSLIASSLSYKRKLYNLNKNNK